MERSTLYISGGRTMNKLTARLNNAANYAYVLWMGLRLTTMIVDIITLKKAKGWLFSPFIFLYEILLRVYEGPDSRVRQNHSDRSSNIPGGNVIFWKWPRDYCCAEEIRCWTKIMLLVLSGSGHCKWYLSVSEFPEFLYFECYRQKLPDFSTEKIDVGTQNETAEERRVGSLFFVIFPSQILHAS